MDDARYINALKAGEDHAFRRLLKEQAPIVFSLLGRLVFDRNKHEDLAQEIFVKIAEKIGTFRGDAKLSTWVYTLAYRHILDHLKSNRRDIIQKSEPIEEFHSLATEDVEADDSDFDVQAALSLLDEKYRIFVTMKYVDNLSLKEIAEITGTTIGLVKTRIHRGIIELRNELTKEQS